MTPERIRSLIGRTMTTMIIDIWWYITVTNKDGETYSKASQSN